MKRYIIATCKGYLQVHLDEYGKKMCNRKEAGGARIEIQF